MNLKRSLLLLSCMLLASAPVWGGNGHLLHGIGAINSSMGGAGVALLEDSLAALSINPALLTKAQGNQVSFSTEFFQDGLRVEARLGNAWYRTDPTTQVGVIPSFGWMAHDPSKKLAIGFGLLGIAGFRTDYPQDSTNFLLVPQPNGFGHVYTDYVMTKIPIAFAFQVNPKLSIGASLNLYRGSLDITPNPIVLPDFSSDGYGWLPNAGNQVSRWGIGGQFGFHYEATPMISIGASYTTKQKFHRYNWNSTVANPSLVTYGQARIVDFDLDGPMSFQFGVGLHPTKKLEIAADGKFIKYRGVKGLGEASGVDLVHHNLIGIGWQNIWVGMVGVNYKINERMSLRAGYNHGQSPIEPSKTINSMGTPSTFQKHFCLGAGMALMPHVSADLGFYVVPRETKAGPTYGLYVGVVPNTEIHLSNSLVSGLASLNFSF